MAINALIFEDTENADAGADTLNSYFNQVSPPRFTTRTHPTREDRFAVGDGTLTEEDMIAAVSASTQVEALYAYGALYWAGLGEHAPPPVPILEPTATSWGEV